MTEQSMVEIKREYLEVARRGLGTARWLIGTMAMAGRLSATSNDVSKQIEAAIFVIDAALAEKTEKE